jgi:hypothetical protein
MSAVRFVIFNKKTGLLNLSHLGKTKLMAFPMANKKEGNTKSVGVKPCHSACINGAKVCAPSPGVLTMIIKQMVIPLKTSKDKKRLFDIVRFWTIKVRKLFKVLLGPINDQKQVPLQS